MRWPSRHEVHAAAVDWAERLARAEPEIRAIGYFGSYARGKASVGSDLDLIAIIADGSPLAQVADRRWVRETLPVPTDLLVYTQEQYARLAAGQSRFWRALCDETIWLLGPDSNDLDSPP